MTLKKGIFILIAGANASGKSSVIKSKYVKERIKHYANPDKLEDPEFPIAEKDILGFKARVMHDEGNAARFAVACVDDWLESERHRKEGIATESNLVSTRDFRKFREAKAAGMRTELYFVGLPLETAIQREKIRAYRKEQKGIGADTVADRYRGIFNIQKHINEGNIDLIKIYDNSRGVGEEELVFHMENGKTIFLNPEPILQWFKDAQALNPEIEIPPFLEKQEQI